MALTFQQINIETSTYTHSILVYAIKYVFYMVAKHFYVRTWLPVDATNHVSFTNVGFDFNSNTLIVALGRTRRSLGKDFLSHAYPGVEYDRTTK